MSYLTTNIKFKDSNLIDIKAEETFVGWYLGEKLYRKVIKYTGAINEGNNEFEHGIQNLKFIIDTKMICANDKIIFPYFVRGIQTNIDRYDETKFTVWSSGDSWSSRIWNFVLYYTKNE